MFGPSRLALVLLGLLAFFNAVRHPFVHDDVVFILQNPHINEVGAWAQAFEPPLAKGGLNTYYRPVLEVVYRLEYRLFGFRPAGFHLFNILVHIANGLLLFSLLQKLALARHAAWFISLIFLIHPVQTEAVSCIAGISNLWMALGLLLSLHAYLNKRHLASLMFYAAAFLSKEQAVMIVPLVMVIDFSRGKPKNFRSWFYWILATGALLALRGSMTGSSLLGDILASPGEFILRLAAIPRDIEMYLRLVFFPYDLHYYRSTDILQSNVIAWILAVVLAAGLIYLYQRAARLRGALILGLGWFLAALCPVLNIVPLINEYSFILTSEHFLYLPLAGILIAAVSAVDLYAVHFKKALAGAVVAVCLLMTWYQNTFWAGEIVLFERMLRYEPNFGRGHLLLAKAYYFSGKYPQADAHFKRTFDIMSGYAAKAANSTAKKYYSSMIKEILFDWSQNDSSMGRWGQALEKLKREEAMGGDAAMYNNMAFIYSHMGDSKQAYLSLQQALRADPSFIPARRNMQAILTASHL
jgi:tetratricopeptide (TPR) repeat protein